jgi:hypothetical protein
MKKITIMFGLLGSIIVFGSVDANAEDCPSGHYYRMSGRCADAPARKPAVAHHPVKPSNKKPPAQGN